MCSVRRGSNTHSPQSISLWQPNTAVATCATREEDRCRGLKDCAAGVCWQKRLKVTVMQWLPLCVGSLLRLTLTAIGKANVAVTASAGPLVGLAVRPIKACSSSSTIKAISLARMTCAAHESLSLQPAACKLDGPHASPCRPHSVSAAGCRALQLLLSGSMYTWLLNATTRHES